jgi:phosphate-selective porin OprO and OprP
LAKTIGQQYYYLNKLHSTKDGVIMKSNMFRTQFFIITLALHFLWSTTAFSQEPTEREKQLEGTVKQLLQRVEELENRANQSDTAQQALKETVEKTTEEKSVTQKEDPNALNASWSNGLTFASKNGDFKLKVGARIHNDWYTGSIDNGDFPDGVRFRRVWLNASGSIYEDFDYKVQYDISGNGALGFKDVYMGYNGLDLAKIRLGQFREPFSLEELTSNNDITFMERSPMNTLAPSRETGLMFYNEILDKRMTWAVGAFKNVNNFGDGQEDDGASNHLDAEDGNWDVMARLTGLPWYEEDGRKLLHLGLAGGHREWSGEEFGESSRGSFSRGSALVNTGVYDADSVDLIGAELALVHGPASLQAEYNLAEVEPAFGGSNAINSYYVQGSYFLTGENRPYKEGAFTYVKPNNNFSLKNGGWGAWELAARYTCLDLDDAAAAAAPGGELTDITLGVNWYMNPNIRVIWNYVHAESDNVHPGDPDNADVFQMRFQLVF